MHFSPVPAPGTKTLHDMVRVEFYSDFLFIWVKFEPTDERAKEFPALWDACINRRKAPGQLVTFSESWIDTPIPYQEEGSPRENRKTRQKALFLRGNPALAGSTEP